MYVIMFNKRYTGDGDILRYLEISYELQIKFENMHAIKCIKIICNPTTPLNQIYLKA